jgi:hypothetical protein
MRLRSLRVACVLTVLALGALCPRPAFAQAAGAEGPALARELLRLMKAADLVVTAMVSAIPAQRAANPKIPKEFWDEFLARAKRDTPGLVDRMVPLYQANFTDDDLRGLIAFYKTPLGQRLVEVQPLLAVQASQVGQAWGADLGRAVGEDLVKRGIKFGGQ